MLPPGSHTGFAFPSITLLVTLGTHSHFEFWTDARPLLEGFGPYPRGWADYAPTEPTVQFRHEKIPTPPLRQLIMRMLCAAHRYDSSQWLRPRPKVKIPSLLYEQPNISCRIWTIKIELQRGQHTGHRIIS
jgi:hypothetical protein